MTVAFCLVHVVFKQKFNVNEPFFSVEILKAFVHHFMCVVTEIGALDNLPSAVTSDELANP